jgi:hypothetical protein
LLARTETVGTSLTEADTAKLWEFYLQLTEVKQAFNPKTEKASLRGVGAVQESCIPP